MRAHLLHKTILVLSPLATEPTALSALFRLSMKPQKTSWSNSPKSSQLFKTGEAPTTPSHSQNHKKTIKLLIYITFLNLALPLL